MTQEGVEIIVTAKVESALKEFDKIVPSIRKTVKQTQEAFSKIDMKSFTKKIKQAFKDVKKEIELLNKYSTSNEVKIKVNNKEAKKQISQIQKEIDSLKEKTNSRKIKLNLTGAKSYKKVSNGQGTNTNIEDGKTEEKQGFLGNFKEKISQAQKSINKFKKSFSGISAVAKNIANKIGKISSGIKNGIGNVVKFVKNLIPLQQIYSVLTSSAQSWLSSQDSQAQQLSANIEYMKLTLGSAFAPVIEYIVNLVYQLMKTVQSLVYAFSGVNIFAKATASSMNKTAGSAKQASKSLSGIHGEINNVSSSEDSGGSGTVSPNIDLSQVDSQMSPLTQKLYDFFAPLKQSWDNYGQGLIEQVKQTASQTGGLISSVWGSFENIITNGTVYSILENILKIIGDIAGAFENAWNYNGNGDAIIQNLADAFDNLLTAIDNVVKSEEFQNWLKWCTEKFREISEKLESIDWEPLVNALVTIGENVGKVVLEILSGLVDILKWLSENPVVAEVILAIAVAIGVISTAISIFNAVASPLTAIILAIIAVVTAVILIITNWGNIVDWIKEKLGPLADVISEVFGIIWDVISTVLGFIWDIFGTVFNAIWNIISPILNAIWNIFSVVFTAMWNIVSSVFTAIWNIISPIINIIWSTIKTALNGIKELWSAVWNTISSIVSGVWNGIWNTIKGVINAILGGIEGFANGIVRGINKVIGALNSIKVSIPDWVPGLGGKTFGLNLKTLSEISIPRLAKGNVAYTETMAIFGEYSGASTNPEITTPQNIMRETFEEVLSNNSLNRGNSSNSDLKQLVIQFGSTKVALEMERLLQQARRQNGNATVTI